jgi:hypothetical protein
MRPTLKPGLLSVWRDEDTLQIGIDPRRAVAVCGVGRTAALVSLLDGSRDHEAIIAAARAYGITAEAADRLITLLASAGVLDDHPAGLLQAMPDGLRSRLAPELATTSLAHGDGDGGARALARRSGAYVRIYGTGKVGALTATLLAAAGIGHVSSRDPGAVSAGDLIPGGLSEADIGAPRAASAARAVRRTVPEARTDDDARRPDLAVLTGRHGPELGAGLLADEVPHLTATAGEAIGIVGPLVIPGRSACLHCLDLARTERDPAWPLVLAQLMGRQASTPACDCVLAASVAAQACAQVLSFTDRGRAGAVTNGTLELVLPGWQWRRRSWEPQARCGCSSGAGSGQCRS